jgi:ribosomal protein S25
MTKKSGPSGSSPKPIFEVVHDKATRELFEQNPELKQLVSTLSRDPVFAGGYDSVQRARQADESHGDDHRAEQRAKQIASALLAEGRPSIKLELARTVSKRLANEGLVNTRKKTSQHPTGAPYTARQIAYEWIGEFVDSWKRKNVSP